MKSVILAALLLAGCATTPATVYPVSPAPTPAGPYLRDHCGEDITPTHPATPDNVVCS